MIDGEESIDGIFRGKFHFPKAELHCHLEGTFRLSTIIDLAKTNGKYLPTYDAKELRKYCVINRKKNLAQYLDSFPLFAYIFGGCKQSLGRITREAVEDKARKGIKYLELRFSPHLLANCEVYPITYCKEKGDVTPRDVVSTVCDACTKAQKDFNIDVRIILSCIVMYPEWSCEVAELCKEFSDRGVVGVDIAGSGDKQGKEILKHQKAFKICTDNGMRVTAHAGEFGCAEEVERAIDILNAQRIGHGYHVINDQDIYNEAKENEIHFEVCPLSSYLTSSVAADMTYHPAVRFMKDKVNFSLSTDNCGIQQTSIYDEYNVAFNKFDFTIRQIQQLNLNALRSAFCEESLKTKLIKEFENSYDN